MPEEPPTGAPAGPDPADLPASSPAGGPLPSSDPAQPGPVAEPAEPTPPASEPPPSEPTPPPASEPPPSEPTPPPASEPPPSDPWQQAAEPASPPATEPPTQAPPWQPPAEPTVPLATGTPAQPYPWQQAAEPTVPLATGAPAQPYPWQGAPPPPARPRRRNRMVFITSGLLLALLALVAVPLVVNRGDDGSPPSGGGSSPTADPAASPEQYQTALTSMDTAFATGWRKLTTARTPATVRNAADALALTAQSEAEKLGDLTPPGQVTAAHGDLVSALEAFSTGLSSDSTENVCAGSSAVPRLSREASLNQVRTAAQALGAADPAHPYRVGTWVPKVAKEPKRRLSNGKYIKRTMSSGAGQLKIKNGGSADGVVSIVAGNGKQPAVVVYVRGKQNFTVRGIRDGTYRIFLSTGTDWDTAAKTFSRDCVFERFDDTFKFRSTSTTYTVWEITVQAVSGGNATAASVSPDDFPIG